MGFDIIGKKARNRKGEYFRSNGWWWRPLWEYVYKVCNDILAEEDLKNGGFNDGHFVNCNKAERIAIRLEHLLNQGEVKKYAEERSSAFDNLPYEVCGGCHGTGKMTYRNGKRERCRVCEGKGKSRDSDPFDEDNVKNFAEFCKNSGGFEIW